MSNKMKVADFQKAVKAQIFERIMEQYPDALQTGEFTAVVPVMVEETEGFCEVSCVAKTYILCDKKRIPYTMEIALDQSEDYLVEKEQKELEAKVKAEAKQKKIERDKAIRDKKMQEIKEKAERRQQEKEKKENEEVAE